MSSAVDDKAGDAQKKPCGTAASSIWLTLCVFHLADFFLIFFFPKWGVNPFQKTFVKIPVIYCMQNSSWDAEKVKNTAQKVIFLTKNVPYGQKCKINHNLLFQIRGTQKWGVGGPTFLHFFLTHPFILFCYHHCIVGVGVNPW